MIMVDYSYKLLNGREVEGLSDDIDSFRRFCQENLRGMCRNGKPPRYMSNDIVALFCEFSDGRQFIWQRHFITKYGRHIGGWQKLSDKMPADVGRLVAKSVCSVS